MTARTRLHFMCGKEGSGKSTVAATLASTHDAVLLCEDIWLARLFPEELHDFGRGLPCPIARANLEHQEE